MMADVQAVSKEVGSEVVGARTRMRRRSASSEMLTRVEDGWGEFVVSVAIVLYLW